MKINYEIIFFILLKIYVRIYKKEHEKYSNISTIAFQKKRRRMSNIRTKYKKGGNIYVPTPFLSSYLNDL